MDAPAGLRVRIFEDFPCLEMDGRTWNDLVARSESRSVFQTYEWLTSWWKIFGARRKPLIIAVYLQDRLVGLAPLMVEPALLGTSTIKFIGEGNADYCNFILTEPYQPVLQAIIDYLASLRTKWCEVELNNIPQKSSTLEWLSPLCANYDMPLLVRRYVDCPTLIFAWPQGNPAYILRKDSLKRPYQYFRSHGDVAYTELTTPSEARAYLPQFFEQHIRRWQGTASPSLFTNPRNREFYAELLERLLPTGWLVFSVVQFNRHPIAFHFGFQFAGRFLWYKPSFDVDYRKHSPGSLLLRFLLQRSIEHDCSEFDFTIGNEDFKHRYSNAMRLNLSLQIFPNRSRFYFADGRQHCRQWFKRLAFWRSCPEGS